MQTAACTFRLVSSRCRIPHTALPRQSPALQPCLPSATAAAGAAPLPDGLFPDTATKEIKKVIIKEKEHPGSLLPLVRFLQTQASFYSLQTSQLFMSEFSVLNNTVQCSHMDQMLSASSVQPLEGKHWQLHDHIAVPVVWWSGENKRAESCWNSWFPFPVLPLIQWIRSLWASSFLAGCLGFPGLQFFICKKRI